jgi:hypothetical protein
MRRFSVFQRFKNIWAAFKGEPRITIHKVEINVQDTEDPSAVAYKVADILSSWKRGTPRAEA